MQQKNVEASKIIGNKGTEHGELLKQLEEVKGERDALQLKLDTNKTKDPANPPTPKLTDPPPTKPVAEQLEEVEARMTDEQWELAGRALSLEKDKQKAIDYNEVPEKRLEFLSELLEATELKEKPTAFTRKTVVEADPNKGESPVKLMIKQITGVAHGPSGRAVAMGGQSHSTQPQTDPRLR